MLWEDVRQHFCSVMPYTNHLSNSSPYGQRNSTFASKLQLLRPSNAFVFFISCMTELNEFWCGLFWFIWSFSFGTPFYKTPDAPFYEWVWSRESLDYIQSAFTYMQRFAVPCDLKSKQTMIKRIKFKTIRKCHLEQIPPGWHFCTHIQMPLSSLTFETNSLLWKVQDSSIAKISPLPWKSLLEKEEWQQINVIGGNIHAWTMHVCEVEQIGFEFKVFGPAENWATLGPLPPPITFTLSRKGDKFFQFPFELLF